MTLPVVYSEDFYQRLINYQRYSKLAYVKDLLVGAISCRYEADEEIPNARVVYIMTITVLKAYRRYGIGSKLLKEAMEDCKKGDVSKIYLHVQCSNESAIEFYKSNGFTIKEKLLGYYTDLDPPHCYIFQKSLLAEGEELKVRETSEEEKNEQAGKKKKKGKK